MLRYIGECPVAIVPIKRMLAGRQTPRAAFNRDSFPPAVRVVAGSGGVFKRKPNVIGNEQIQVSVTVVVHEGAAGPKPLLIVPKASRLGHIGESSVAVIAVQRVLSKIGAKYVVKAVVVIVSDRDSTCPSEPVQTRFLRDIRECPVPVVLVQPIRRAVGGACEARAGENKQIHPPIIVIVNEGAPASGGLHDVLFALFIAIDHRRVESRGGGHVHEVGVERAPGRRRSCQGLGGMGRNALSQQAGGIE